MMGAYWYFGRNKNENIKREVKSIKKIDKDDAAFYISNGGPLSKVNENIGKQFSLKSMT